MRKSLISDNISSSHIVNSTEHTYQRRAMKRNKEIEMMSGGSFEENAYANVDDFNLKRKKNAPKAKEIAAAKNTQYRLILILGILLILVFITLVTLTTFLFISYKSISEEMSQMRNDSLSSEVQSIWGAVRNLEKVQTASNSDVKYNLTYEVMASFSSDIQRILGFLGKVAEELQKMKSSSNPLCSERWNHYGLSCYYLSSDTKPWNASKKDCENKKSHLVVINSEEEMNFLRGIANKQFFWIGLTDADGTWRWVDGTSYDITPKFWGNTQPDDWKGHNFKGGEKGEDCAMVRDGIEWNDLHCSETIKYICEKKITF
ncbi:C-type lectin domain family 10 member A-like [Aquarana catesbeiana]|uniref:C-type lectin domain family 10 member A-like n=1 Tax=Aquarana catesbeiana TaxID=8400 RepID=UPI003CC92F1C